MHLTPAFMIITCTPLLDASHGMDCIYTGTFGCTAEIAEANEYAIRVCTCIAVV